MKKIFIAAHPTEAHLVRGWLASEGIETVVMGEALFAARGVAPVTPDTLPTLWVLNDEDEADALELLASHAESAPSRALGDRAWRCPTCNEFIGPEFSDCWRCGQSQPIAVGGLSGRR